MARIERRDVLKLGGLASLTPLAPHTQADKPSPRRRPPDRRAELYGLLGALPDRRRPIRGTKREETERDGYVLETWDLDLNGLENVPAYLARPRTVAGRAPAVLFNHSHGGGYTIGKTEVLEGRTYLTGDNFTFADIAIGVMADWWYGMPIDHFELPRLHAWYRRLADRPAFQQTMARRIAGQG